MLSLRHFLDCFFCKRQNVIFEFFLPVTCPQTNHWTWMEYQDMVAIYHIEIFQYFMTFCWRFLLLKTCSLVLLTLTVNFHSLQYDQNIFSDDFLMVYYQFYKKRKYFLSSYRSRFTIIIHIINYSKYYIVIKFFLEISSATNVQ